MLRLTCRTGSPLLSICCAFCQQQTHIFPEVHAAQRCPEVTRTAGCIVTDFKCEEEEPSSPITSVRWKAPKAASHPAGHSSAVIRSVWQEWQVLDLLSGFLSLSHFLAYSLSLFLSLSRSVSLLLPLADTLYSPHPLGCCQGAKSPSPLYFACICCLFVPSVFNEYNRGSLVVVLMLYHIAAKVRVPSLRRNCGCTDIKGQGSKRERRDGIAAQWMSKSKGGD